MEIKEKDKKIKVKFKKLNSNAQTPVYKSEEAAAFDLHSVEEKIILPGETTIVCTGIAIELPKGFCLQFWDRSSLGSKGITKFAGLIDSDYRGELKVVFNNTTKQPYKIEKGDRIIQGAIVPIIQIELEEINELSQTKRADGAFGSTGK